MDKISSSQDLVFELKTDKNETPGTADGASHNTHEQLQACNSATHQQGEFRNSQRGVKKMDRVGVETNRPILYSLAHYIGGVIIHTCGNLWWSEPKIC